MLIGRQREVSSLTERLTGASTVAVLGAAGIGKTTLLREAASATGRTVHEGGALATIRWVSFLPFVRALGETPVGDLLAVADVVCERVANGVLLLDDLHWADPETLALLPLLAGRVAIAAGVRTGDAGTAVALKALGASQPLELDELAPADAERLVLARRPGTDATAVAAIIRAAGGNPFLLGALAESSSPSSALRHTLRARFERCSPEARRAMSLLALLGRPATRSMLGAAVDELAAVALVVERPDGFEPRHALIAEFTTEALPATERRAHHAWLAQAVEDSAESARHHAAAGEREQARVKALRAAADAVHPGERASHLGLAASCAEGEEADGLRLEAAAELVEAGLFDEARLLAESVEGDDLATLARSALLRGRAAWMQGDREPGLRAIDRGIELVRGTGLPIEAELLLQRLRDDLYFANSDVVVAQARVAWRASRASGTELVRADCYLGTAVCWHARSVECLPILERAFASAAEQGNHDLYFTAASALIGARQIFARPDGLAALERDLIEHARGLGLRRWELQFTWMLGQDAQLHGRYAEAIPLLEACLAQPAMGQPDRDQVASDLAIALAEIGRPRDAMGLVQRARAAADTAWGRLTLLIAEAEVSWLAGKPKLALAAAEEALRGDQPAPGVGPQLMAMRDWALLDLGRPPVPPVESACLPYYAGYALDSEAIWSLTRSGRGAEAGFRAAAEAYSGNVLRNELRSLWVAGDLALADASVRGRRTLFEVEERAEAHGITPLLARVRRSLRKAGVRRSAPRSMNGQRLTGREHEVLQLVSVGHTSSEIALNLGVSRSTVETLVRSAMRKLDAKTRTHAAALAETRSGGQGTSQVEM